MLLNYLSKIYREIKTERASIIPLSDIMILMQDTSDHPKLPFHVCRWFSTKPAVVKGGGMRYWKVATLPIYEKWLDDMFNMATK